MKQKIIEKINKVKSWSSEKNNKINQAMEKLIKKKREKKKFLNGQS